MHADTTPNKSALNIKNNILSWTWAPNPRSVRIDSMLAERHQCLCLRVFDNHHVRTNLVYAKLNRQPLQTPPSSGSTRDMDKFWLYIWRGWVCSIFTHKYSSTPPHKSSGATNVNQYTNTAGGHQPPVCKCVRYIISHMYAYSVLEMLSIHPKSAPAPGPACTHKHTDHHIRKASRVLCPQLELTPPPKQPLCCGGALLGAFSALTLSIACAVCCWCAGTVKICAYTMCGTGGRRTYTHIQTRLIRTYTNDP